MIRRLRGAEWNSVSSVGIVLAAFAIGTLVGGPLVQYRALALRQLFIDLWANLGTELASIAATVLIIDALNQRRDAQRLKEQLIREMGSRDNGTALRAVEELQARGWLGDGALQGADLRRANLRGARLTRADLEQADLYNANLNDAYLVRANLHRARRLTDHQLAGVRSLQHATMPDGSRYDGRFSLARDIQWAHENNVDIDDPAAMAEFYGVSVDEYSRGQEWWAEKGAKLRPADFGDDV
jgi:hypothetical protein